MFPKRVFRRTLDSGFFAPYCCKKGMAFLSSKRGAKGFGGAFLVVVDCLFTGVFGVFFMVLAPLPSSQAIKRSVKRAARQGVILFFRIVLSYYKCRYIISFIIFYSSLF